MANSVLRFFALFSQIEKTTLLTLFCQAPVYETVSKELFRNKKICEIGGYLCPLLRALSSGHFKLYSDINLFLLKIFIAVLTLARMSAKCLFANFLHIF